MNTSDVQITINVVQITTKDVKINTKPSRDAYSGYHTGPAAGWWSRKASSQPLPRPGHTNCFTPTLRLSYHALVSCGMTLCLPPGPWAWVSLASSLNGELLLQLRFVYVQMAGNCHSLVHITPLVNSHPIRDWSKESYVTFGSRMNWKDMIRYYIAVFTGEK